MPRIKLTVSTYVGTVFYAKGETVAVSDDVAASLITNRHGVAISQSEKAAPNDKMQRQHQTK